MHERDHQSARRERIEELRRKYRAAFLAPNPSGDDPTLPERYGHAIADALELLRLVDS